jgi:hypothetical protein
MNLKKITDLKFDKGWKYLVYFDFLLPALIYLIAYLSQAPFAAKIFHSYEMFIVNPIPNIKTLTGIIGLVYHTGILGYAIKKHHYADLAVSAVLALLTAAFFFFEINYLILKPLTFASF